MPNETENKAAKANDSPSPTTKKFYYTSSIGQSLNTKNHIHIVNLLSI